MESLLTLSIIWRFSEIIFLEAKKELLKDGFFIRLDFPGSRKASAEHPNQGVLKL